ncbi:hypothetical protein RAS1_02290 [Phycisphaerae bacterium RAS1]|nr:hypothetical protein RAS1_02290 [Phycisphaerae bacterium RAS1]
MSKRLILWLIPVLLTLMAAPPSLYAGGTPENALLIIDPTNAESLYIGNYYKNARNIPDANVIYMDPLAPNYSTFGVNSYDALFGQLANAAIEDHVDYIIVPSGGSYWIAASGIVTDGCAPVFRFSTSACYFMSFIRNEVLAGNYPSTAISRYYRGDYTARAFDSSTAWLSGSPSTSTSARRYFLAAMLGYTGELGNTPAEITAMIDRSVAADGTRPAGTFYFMQTSDVDRSGPRDDLFAQVRDRIVNVDGGLAEVQSGVLPGGATAAIGVMTGWAAPDIDGTSMTLLPGAYGDHLTSWAATFDIADQTKVSRWIAKGASASWGAVQEPCNYAGKFPNARAFSFYQQGLSLGEAIYRAAAYVPFQMLFYGDPLTRPFAHIPTVSVPDAPVAPVAGTVTLTPTASTSHPTATIAQLEMLLDGVSRGLITPGGSFMIDTATIADGWHELRVLAYDSTLVKSVGRWIGSMTVANDGRAATLAASLSGGDLQTLFTFDLTSAGGSPIEMRLVQNGRVIAAEAGGSAMLDVYGRTIGGGTSRLQAEAVFADGRVVRSPPTTLAIAYSSGTPDGAAPAAFGYQKRVRNDKPFLLELPTTFADAGTPLTYELLTAPTKCSPAFGYGGPFRLYRPIGTPVGSDRLTFRVTSAAGDSGVATVRILYGGALLGDLNCDGATNILDINAFTLALADSAAYASAYPACAIDLGDVNGDGSVDVLDINPFIALLTG